MVAEPEDVAAPFPPLPSSGGVEGAKTSGGVEGAKTSGGVAGAARTP